MTFWDHGPRLSFRTPRVITYHNFGDPPATGDPAGLFVGVDAFREQLALLRRNGWRALSLDEFVAALDGVAVPRKSFLLTIDDGHVSALRHAAPILAEQGIPSVFFVPPAVLGGPLSWNPAYLDEQLGARAQIAALSGTGMEVGVHSWDHSRMVGMTEAELDRQVSQAREAVHSIMGYLPRSFAYPYGAYDAEACRAVESAGYAVAFATGRERGRFAVDRVGVAPTDSPLMFRLKLSLAYRLVTRVACRLPWLRYRHHVRAAVRSIVRHQKHSGDNNSADNGYRRQ
jgi:peptidoglycan/xylan/chitin deacetylase (PgdA/CDA1 family)